MGGQEGRVWRRVLLVILGAIVAGCGNGETSPSARGKKLGSPMTPEAAMASLPQADVVKRIKFRELWRLDKSQMDWCESLILPAVSKPLTPDGKLFVTSVGTGSDGRIQFRSMKTGQAVRSLALGEGIDRLWFSPDGTKVVVFLRNTRPGPRQGDLLLCDANTGERVRKFATPDAHYPEAFAFDPAGRHFVTGGLFGECLLFDVTQETSVLRFQGQQGRVRRLSFSRDGRLVAAGDDGPATTYWNVADGKQTTAPPPAEDDRPSLPHIEAAEGMHLCFESPLPDDKGRLYEFTIWTPVRYATGICFFDRDGRLTAWGVLPDHAGLRGVSPDGRHALSEDTREPEYGISELHPALTRDVLRASGGRESIPPIRCWEMDLGDG